MLARALSARANGPTGKVLVVRPRDALLGDFRFLDHHRLDFPKSTNSILLTVHKTPIFPRLDKDPKFRPWRSPRLLSRTASPSPATPSSSRLAT